MPLRREPDRAAARSSSDPDAGAEPLPTRYPVARSTVTTREATSDPSNAVMMSLIVTPAGLSKNSTDGLSISVPPLRVNLTMLASTGRGLLLPTALLEQCLRYYLIEHAIVSDSQQSDLLL